jgi:uncharacterized membrane protein
LKLKRSADLITAGLVAAGGALVIEHAPYAYVHLGFALLLLFVLPGYAITQALFAGRPRSLSQLLLLTIGLSLSVSILTALVLSLATNGLRTGSWLTVVVAIVLGACWSAIRRRDALEPEALAIAAAPSVSLRLRVRDVILLLIASVVVVGALVFARTPLTAKNVQGYTALSIVEVSAGTRPTVRVSATSEELHTRLYRVVLRSGTKVTYTRRIELVPGQRWSATVRVPRPPPGRQMLVEAALYWNYQPDTEYRSVHVWVGPAGARD